MEIDDSALFDTWLANWSDLGTFDVVPAIKSDEAARRVNVSWIDATR